MVELAGFGVPSLKLRGGTGGGEGAGAVCSVVVGGGDMRALSCAGETAVSAWGGVWRSGASVGGGAAAVSAFESVLTDGACAVGSVGGRICGTAICAAESCGVASLAVG